MEILKKLTNTKTLVALVCTAGLLAKQFGLQVDLEWLDTTINLVCSIGILLGVLNNKGMETTKMNL